MPPAMPMPNLKNFVNNAPGSVGMQPMAVLMLVPSGQNGLVLLPPPDGAGAGVVKLLQSD